MQPWGPKKKFQVELLRTILQMLQQGDLFVLSGPVMNMGLCSVAYRAWKEQNYFSQAYNPQATFGPYDLVKNLESKLEPISDMVMVPGKKE